MSLFYETMGPLSVSISQLAIQKELAAVPLESFKKLILSVL